MIPRFRPWLSWAELRAMFQRNHGAVVHFEREFSHAFNAVDALSFSYGRSALWAFLRAVGLSDAEVVMPAYTCSVVAHAVTLSGNRPRFVDIRLEDYNMDLDQLESAISKNTRAVIATHLFGYPMDLDRLKAIIEHAESRYGHKIWLIQDCAHSFGATWRGQMVGSVGDVALYGLNVSKMMTSIFGGMLTFQDQGLADRVRAWRNQHFRQPDALKPWGRRLYLFAAYLAFNSHLYGLTWWLQEKTPLLNRLTKSYHLDEKVHFPPDFLDQMTELEAAVGLQQLKKYPRMVELRRANALWYDRNLKRRDGWIFPSLVEGATYSHFVIRVPDKKEVVQEWAGAGIHLGELIQYSVPRLTAYETPGVDYPNSDTASRTTINLPIDPGLNEDALRRVAARLR